MPELLRYYGLLLDCENDFQPMLFCAILVKYTSKIMNQVSKGRDKFGLPYSYCSSTADRRMVTIVYGIL